MKHHAFGLAANYPFTVIKDFSTESGWAREPVLRRLPDGSLLCLHFTGGRWEPDNANYIEATRSHDDGASWSAGEVLFRHPGRGVWGPELFIDGETVHLPVHTFDSAGWFCGLRLHPSSSQDSGKTWGEPASFPGYAAGFSLRRGFVMSNGEWFFPVYCQEQAEGFSVEWTREHLAQGRNWPFCIAAFVCEPGWKNIQIYGYQKTDLRRLKVASTGVTVERNSWGLWEPNVVEIEPGHLVMLMRASGTGLLYRTESRDFGRTWSKVAPSEIPNGDSKITLLKIGASVVLLGNQTGSGRTPLSLWVSRDGCATWDRKIELAAVDDRREAAAIPFCGPMVCYPDGFADEKRRVLYLTFEDGIRHYLMKIPFAEFLNQPA